MNEIPQNWGLRSPTLTLYAFHLRNSINQGLEPTVLEAPRLWEQLVDLGNKLDIPELQNLQQQLISYQNHQYFPEAEDNQASEYCTLLRNRQASLDFLIIAPPDGFPLQGLLCPYRLHDSYAIDLTLCSQERFFLSQLCKLNPQYLLLPSHIQASLGQTLLLFGQPIELQENYQDLADACVVQLVLETDKPELINTAYLLGNPIFEYESQHKDPSKQLHILVWVKCQSMDTDDMDKASELLLYLLWCRHKIQYVYHESRWCDRQLKQLYNRIEQHRNSFSQISRSLDRQRQFRQLLAELREIDIEYSGYLGDLDSHENTIAINEQNYRAKLEKLKALPETELSSWRQFLDYVCNKLQHQIQADRRFLALGRDRLQHLKAIVEESLTKDFENNDMPGIPAPLYKRLSEALSQCDQFESNEELRSLFKGYAILSPWANSLPQANSTAQRVTLVIGFLVEQYRYDTKENVLVILVRLLSQRIESVDSRHQTLSELADELSIILSRSGANPDLADGIARGSGNIRSAEASELIATLSHAQFKGEEGERGGLGSYFRYDIYLEDVVLEYEQNNDSHQLYKLSGNWQSFVEKYVYVLNKLVDTPWGHNKKPYGRFEVEVKTINGVLDQIRVKAERYDDSANNYAANKVEQLIESKIRSRLFGGRKVT